jgi:hypothetical protein
VKTVPDLRDVVLEGAVSDVNAEDDQCRDHNSCNPAKHGTPLFQLRPVARNIRLLSKIRQEDTQLMRATKLFTIL